jgi:tetratricopeptide (TPR) repeat protein
LIYYNVGDYSKAALAFEQAIAMEDGVAVRFIAYAKTQEKIGNLKNMTEALEKAVAIEENPQTLKMLASAYQQSGQTDLADDLRDKADKMIIRQVKPEKLTQPRRVIM